ncbi:MAG: hypothetical protein CL878_09815 [Dehalococcoidia bacterium]|nr:hypothetical protein [Dehalococcoidia bacterium]
MGGAVVSEPHPPTLVTGNRRAISIAHGPAVQRVMRRCKHRLPIIERQIAAYWPERTGDHPLLLLFSCVVFSIDDVLDSQPPAPTVAAELARFLPWQRLDASMGADDSRAALAAVAGELRARQPSLMDVWQAEGERTVRAMRREALWRVQGRRPAFSTYMRVAMHSLGVVWMGLTLAVLGPDHLGRDDLALFRRKAGRVARACRVLNDLATWRRERAEGKVNLVQLQSERVGEIDQAVALVEHMYAEARARALAVQRRISVPRLAPAIIGLVRLSQVLEQQYAQQDYPGPVREV